jgi:integrase
MATFKYFLRDSKATGSTQVVLFISDSKKIKIPSGQSIHPKHWDQKEQKVKRSLTGFADINAVLKSFAARVESAYLKFIADGIQPTPEQIREAVAIKEEQPEVLPAIVFKEAYTSFQQVYEHTKRPATVKKFKTLLIHLEGFAQYRKQPLTFESIDLKYYELFTIYLTTEREYKVNNEVKVKEGHTNNTVGKVIANLKTFLNWAIDRGYPVNPVFRKFKVPTEKTETIYLTEAELMSLYSLDLTSNKTLSKVRDVFCFGCFTGQRFSDIAGLKKDDIKGNTWHVRTLKTKDVIEVPLNAYALEILNRYFSKDLPLPVMSNQKTNFYLKELAKLAEIGDLITQVRFRGNKRVQDMKPKHELISTHTARRTFVTLWLEKGGRPETCMEITGHADYKTFKKYIKITSKVKAVEMDQIWHKEPVMKVSASA